MKRNVKDRDVMLELQGDIVLVIADKQQFLYTIVRFVDGTEHRLELSDRTRKPKERGENLPLSQAVLDNLVPIKHEKAKWKLVL